MTEQIKQLQAEILQLKLKEPYSPIIKKKLLELDNLFNARQSTEQA
jgi:hypothetical protein